VDDNTSASNRALNRRVEIYIAENDQPVKQRR
jgi:flagellar motor protein MotB